MPLTLSAKPIIPRNMNIRRVEQELLKALKDEGQEDAKLLNKPTATWKGEKPTIRPEVGQSGNDAYVRTEPGGNAKGVKKFTWLDKGTSVRWALMSRDWKSKTRPGYLASYRGRGRVVVAGRRRMKRPQPGIKARGWSERVYRQRAPKFRRAMREANRRGIANIYA